MNQTAVSPHIFRAYDIRGIYNEDIDPTLFYKIGLAAGTYLQKNLKGKTMTAGADIRCSSPTLLHSFVSGVLATGANITMTGITSFGQTLFNGCKQNDDLISFVTASHLPAEWNGIKFYYGDGVGLPTEELNKIRDNVLDDSFELKGFDGIGQIRSVEPTQPYIDFFKDHFSYSKKLNVAVDCGGASMTLSAPHVMKALGVDVSEVFCTPNPLFSDRPSEPKPDNLSALIDTISRDGCDFGVAFDGDGDRSVIIDDRGVALSSDETGILLGKYGFSKHEGVVIVNVECSKAVSEQLTPLGFSVKQIPVGHTHLTLHAKKECSPLGIESSGHLILPNYFLFDDALIVPLKIAEILDESEQSLSELRRDIPIYPLSKKEIKCPDDLKFEVIEKLKVQLQKEYDDVNTMDGIRVNEEQGWSLIRASNTSPIIRVTTEADDKISLEQISSHFVELTQKLVESMQD